MKNISSSIHLPLLFDKKIYQSIAHILLATLFLGLCAQIKIPLPFTPVPLTGQTFGVILIGALLGPKKGVMAVIAYLFEGSCGLPVWAGGGHAGLAHLFGPTGGYLLACPLQAYLVGTVALRTRSQHFIPTLAGIFGACCLQLSMGALWLTHFVSLHQAFALGFFPFLTIELCKAALATGTIKATHRQLH